MDYFVKDLNLSGEGKLKIEWAKNEMKVLNEIRKKFTSKKPFKGIKIGACLHVTSETANLMIALKEAGAEVYLTASNPLSTQDDVAASLVKDFETPVFAVRGEDKETYYKNIKRVIEKGINITMDDGADLVSMLHSKMRDYLKDIIGGTEETTTGVIRLRSLEKEKVLSYPIIAVNDAKTKHFFDNRFGTGQSTIDGILRATNILLAGKVFVVAGFGFCGRGIAERARGMGARVIVTEVDPVKALEAAMEGFEIMKMEKASLIGDIFVTATGDYHVIRLEHFEKMKDGVILGNSGHFNVEIDVEGLERISKGKKEIRKNLTEYTLKNGKRIYLVAEGRLLNLSAAEGHPSSVMDMSFSNQFMSVKFLVENRGKLEKKVYNVPEDIDNEIARVKLKTMGFEIDELTDEQRKYLSSWEIGT
ncbi:MAG: adenosylhomocysteinase [Caldiserica bacterium]|nr:MAG: adenosylhomocysteinase [Caldisericota bacterium]